VGQSRRSFKDTNVGALRIRILCNMGTLKSMVKMRKLESERSGARMGIRISELKPLASQRVGRLWRCRDNNELGLIEIDGENMKLTERV
jgi:hypothetical protein